MRRWLGFPSLTLLTLALVGCAGGKGDLSGTVNFKGKPIPAGLVTVASQVGEKQVFSSTIEDGKYAIAGVPAGPVKISVATYPPSKPAPKLPSTVQEIEGPKATTTAASPPGKYVPIPQKYSLPDQSGLDYTVTKGPQQHDIDLAP